MNNPISDKDWTMYPERPEILEKAKNGTDTGIDNFGRRVRVGTFYGDRADVQFRQVRRRMVEYKITITNRAFGYRYVFDIVGDWDDWDSEEEYILQPFERGYLGFRIVRNR